MLMKIGSAAIEKEATAGTAETIDSADVTWVTDFKVAPAVDMRERNVVRDVPDLKAPIKGSVAVDVSGAFEMRGSGTAGTANGPLGDLLQACGLTETADAGYNVAYTPDTDLSGVGSVTAKEFRDGKYRTGKGIRGNASFSLKAGEVGVCNFTGRGAFEASGDVSVLAEPSDTTKPPLLTSATMHLLEYHAATLHEDLDGDAEMLRKAGGVNEELSTTLLTVGAIKPRWVYLNLKKNTAPEGETHGVWVEIQTNNAGDPSGTAVTNGTSAYIATSLISTTAGWYGFYFATTPALSATTTYHVVVKGDYTGDDTKNISVDTDAVLVGAQLSKKKSTTYSALSLENLSMRVVGATNPDLTFDGAEIDLGQDIALQLDPNDDQGYDQAYHTSRKITAKLNPLEKLDATRDLYDYLSNATDLFFSVTLGSTAGNKIEFRMDHAVAIEAGQWEDRDGMITHPVTIQCEEPTRFGIYFT